MDCQDRLGRQSRFKLIADALIKHGSLDGEAIYQLLASASRIRPEAPDEYGFIHVIGRQAQ